MKHITQFFLKGQGSTLSFVSLRIKDSLHVQIKVAIQPKILLCEIV